ncbi:MAG: hypothetical protein M1830_002557 [Pleopsidium flavum]|nr:MAG: hypothetical protein M1830_002557 [Pleopsidium flavum]
MPPTLDALPFDVLFNISSGLNFEDYVNLGDTNKQLRSFLSGETICKRAVNAYISCTKEAHLTRTGSLTYAEAVRRVFRRREAFAAAQPSSVLILGYGTSFVYQYGVLCYTNEQTIRVLDVHDASQKESIISIPTLIEYALREDSKTYHGQLTLLQYSDRILVCLYELEKDFNDAWLIAIDVRPGPPTRKRIRVAIRLDTSEKLFVRHNKNYLYYGTHSGFGSHGHREWIIKGISLCTPGLSVETESLQLADLVGSDIGCTVAFEIHEGYFYALSNQTSFEIEEVDWTSYYHCCRFPLDKPRKQCLEINREIWRRQHIEGPINDSWNDLGLRIDERSGELLIVECRREWQGGGSQSQRTYYTQPIIFQDYHQSKEVSQPSSVDAGASENASSLSHALPADDPLTSTIDASNKPHWAPPRKRLYRDYHAEEHALSNACRSFILAKTRYRTYNPCSSSFLDLVLDDTTSPSTVASRLPRQLLRIRIGSRKLASPFNEDGSLRLPELKDETGEVLKGSEERFVGRGIRLWPPRNVPAELLDVLQPCSNLSEVEATSDERSIVYMTGSSDSTQGRGIVLINFDSAIKFPDLPLLKSRRAHIQPLDGSEGWDLTLLSRRSEDYKGKGKAGANRPVSANVPVPGITAPWFRSEKAMYCDIGKGFRLC